jgi:hypothetical protein
MTHVTGAYRVPSSSMQPVSEVSRGRRVTGSQRDRGSLTPPPGKVPVVARPAIILDGKSQRNQEPPPPDQQQQPPSKSAQTRPPARRAQTSIRSMPNLFGSDLISERSLDEVILGYLAEEDGTEGEKK